LSEEEFSLGTARQTSSSDSAQVILQAARRCFAKQGYHGTSIKTIAAEAGVRSPSILHYHFQNKEAIFLAVMRQTLGALTEKATATGLNSSQQPRGLGAIEAFFTLIDEEEDLPPLFMECMAMSARGQATRDEFSSLLTSLEDMVESAIKLLLGDYAARLPLDPKTLAGTIIDLMTGHAIRATLLGHEETRARRQGILTLLGSLRPIDSPMALDPSKER
jgi:AcrR family transcriptional regulator